MIRLLWWLACVAPPAPAPATGEVPRTPEAACDRLQALGATCRCEGGTLGDEVSYLCEGALGGVPYTLSAVTTGAALPPPAQGVGAMADDLWLEVEHGPGSQGLLERFVR